MNTTPDQVARRSGELFNRGLCGSESVLQAPTKSSPDVFDRTLEMEDGELKRAAKGNPGGADE
jgi:hypothetical protein